MGCGSGKAQTAGSALDGTPLEALTAESLTAAPYNQGHLFTVQAEPKPKDQCDSIVEQLNVINNKLPGGGLEGYLTRARGLLQDAKAEKNPFLGKTVKVPSGEKLFGDTGPGTASYGEFEKAGMEKLSKTCFCLVAGGLGERLGYPGIKIGITSEVTTGTCFLETYAKFILAFQAYARKNGGKADLEIPLAIMTSGDTEAKTLELLNSKEYFGLSKSQVIIMCQEKVPALVDIDAKISCEGGKVDTKPHGHGDVHALLHQQGLISKWKTEGREWLVMFQDTNPLPFRSICAVLGVSAKYDYAMNSVTVPRLADEAVGAICTLEDPAEPDKSLTINVEYNQLDALLKTTAIGGDKADDSGFSPYPGNINILVFGLAHMEACLATTGGIVPEFVNPKWKDPKEKSAFKKPTRLECMMQDFPMMCNKTQKVGFTQLDRLMCFTCVKNSLEDAKVKDPKDCAFSAESDIYSSNALILKLAGVEIEEPEEVTYLGITRNVGARIILQPSFGISLEEIKSKVKGKVTISKKSVLILEGDVTIDGLELDGALTVTRDAAGAGVLKDKVCKNAGCPLEAIPDADMATVAEDMKIRGYRMTTGEMEKVAA